MDFSDIAAPKRVSEGQLLANQVVHPKDNSLDTILKARDGASDPSLEAVHVPFKSIHHLSGEKGNNLIRR
jgi:hypothetical protein